MGLTGFGACAMMRTVDWRWFTVPTAKQLLEEGSKILDAELVAGKRIQEVQFEFLKELRNTIQSKGYYILVDGIQDKYKILSIFYDLAEWLGFVDLMAEIEDVLTGERKELLEWVMDSAFDMFDQISPEGYYFGHHIGDKQKIGWFRVGLD